LFRGAFTGNIGETMTIRFGCVAVAVWAASMSGVLAAQAPQGAILPASALQASQTPSSPKLQERYPRYVVKRLDVLTLSFPLTPELNQTVTVQPDGYISLSGASSIHVEGLTAPQVEAAVKAAYAATLNNPIVAVDLKNAQNPFFTVSGQVGKPGQYELRAEINVAEAVAIAGGLQPTAKQQIYVFHRSSPDMFTVQKVDLERLMKGKNLKEDATIRPGDMVLVPESKLTTFKKYVPYTIGASYFPGTF
jgi:polysaccharide export outer membrane protein